MFGLRKVNRNTHTFETTFQNWKENGEDVALLMPEFSAKWLPIAEESGSWSGWVLHQSYSRLLFGPMIYS